MTEDELFVRILADPQVQCKAIATINPTRTALSLHVDASPAQALWCLADADPLGEWDRADIIRWFLRAFPMDHIMYRLSLRPRVAGGELI